PFRHVLLTNQCVLEKLHLGANQISNDGVLLLTEILKTNTTLKVLWLDNNRINDQGVHNLTNVLCQQNKTLRELSLKKNKLITSSSVKDFIRMIEKSQSLKELDLSFCNLTKQNGKQLRDAIRDEKQFVLRVNEEKVDCVIS
ncbi:unnamed protein product, partial [Adineta ricciae]